MITEIQLGKKNKYYCSYCKKEFKRRDCAESHERTCDNASTSNATKPILQTGGGAVGKFELTKASRTGTYELYRLIFPDGTAIDDIKLLHDIIFNDVPQLIDDKRTGKLRESPTGCFKWYLALKARFAKAGNPNIVTDPPAVFQTHPVISFHSWGDEIWKQAEEQLTDKIDKYERNGSGWILDKILSLDITVCAMENPLGRPIEDSDDDDEEEA